MIRIIRTGIEQAIEDENFITSRVLVTATESGSIIDVDKITMHIGDIDGEEVILISNPLIDSTLLINKLKDIDRAIEMISSAIKETREKENI